MVADVASINDVAKLAKVSISTVSLAINYPERVSEQTRQKIFRAMKELRYTPSSKSVQPGSAKKNSVALITSEVSGPYFYEIMRGISETLTLNDLEMILLSGPDAEKRHFHEMAESPFVRGIILLGIDEPLGVDAAGAVQNGVPVVIANAGSEIEGVGSVSVDNYHIGETVANHILHIGYRRVALLGERNRERIPRAAGFVDALRAGGITIPPELDIPVYLDEKSGYFAMEQFLERGTPLPEVIYCLNDEIALGVMSALGQRGIRVPQEVAVIGCDDVSVSRYVDPPLTTVALPKFEQGMLSVIQLLRQASGMPAENIVLNAKLVIRESCGYRLRQSGRRSVQREKAESGQKNGD